MLNQTRHSRLLYLGITFILLASNLVSACKPSPPPFPTVTAIPTPTPEPTPIPALHYVEQGDVALLKSDWGASEAAYRQAMQWDANFAPAYSHLAFLYALQPKFWNESQELAQKAVDIAPSDPEALAYLSLVSVLEDRYDQLPTSAQKAVELDEKNVLAHVALAQAQLILNKVEEAKTEVTRALELDPQNVLALITQASYHSKQGEFDEAVFSAEKAVDLQPDFVYARLALAQTHQDILEYKEAEEQLEKALKVNPDYVPAILALARLKAAQDQRSSAWDVMERAGETAQDIPAALVTQGQLYLKSSGYDQALTRFQKAVLLDKAYWPAYMGQGQAQYAMSQCQNAVDSFRQALYLFPASGLGHLWLARSLECMGEDKRAEEGYRQALELAPHDPQVLTYAGGNILIGGDYQQGMNDYRKAIIQQLYEPEMYERLGYAYINSPSGQDAAESNFEQALTLKDKDLWALVGMGRIYNNRQEYQKAIETLTQASYIYPTSAMIHHGLGVAYAMQGDYQQAINHLDQAWRLDNQDPTTLLYLARAYREVKDYKNAAWAYKEFLKTDANVLSRSYMPGVIQDLSSGQYRYAESQVLYYLRQNWRSTVQSYLKDYLTLSLASATVETVDGKRTLKMVLEIEDEKYDDDALSIGISVATEFGTILVPRIQPPLDGGLYVVMRDAKRQDLIETRVSLQTAQDMLDGLIADSKTFLQKISLRDLRRWKAGLPLDQALAAIGRNVEEDRDLNAKQQVQYRFITQDELRARVTKEYQKTDKERRAFQDMLTLLGLTESSPDLEAKIEKQVSQIAGFYDPKDKVFYVVAQEGEMNVQNELTFAHEYAHALQDQYRDLSALEDDTALTYDQQMAFRAVVEGEATQVALKYFTTRLTLLEQMTVMQQDQTSQAAAEESGRLFPYLTGLAFVQAVARDGYWPALDDVYKNLPASTEQVMHPDRYKGKRDDPQTVTPTLTLSQLGEDWQEIYSDVMGEYFIQGYLAGHVSSDLATVAADGWDGDRYALYQSQGGRNLLVVQITWDSAEDALEFVMAHQLAFGKDAKHKEALRELHGKSRTLRWESDQRSIYLRQKDDTTWLVFASRSSDLDTVIPLLKEE